MGHGHVKSNPDGSKARCGGPSVCGECAKEAGHASAGEYYLLNKDSVQAGDRTDRPLLDSRGVLIGHTHSIHVSGEMFAEVIDREKLGALGLPEPAEGEERVKVSVTLNPHTGQAAFYAFDRVIRYEPRTFGGRPISVQESTS